MSGYPWYEIIGKSDEILQGDLISECPILIPDGEIEEGKIPGKILEYNVVVMSQSCDLENNNIEIILVCPIWSYKTLEKQLSHFKSSKGKNNLIQGNYPGYHLINKIENGINMPHQVVDFRSVFGVHINVLKKICVEKENRLRLLPPYREHLSQAFARFFMRVGLPNPVDPLE